MIKSMRGYLTVSYNTLCGRGSCRAFRWFAKRRHIGVCAEGNFKRRKLK